MEPMYLLFQTTNSQLGTSPAGRLGPATLLTPQLDVLAWLRSLVTLLAVLCLLHVAAHARAQEDLAKPRLEIETVPEEPTKLVLLGHPGFDYRLESSIDLTDWTTLSSVRALGERCAFYDEGPALTQRFYRAQTEMLVLSSASLVVHEGSSNSLVVALAWAPPHDLTVTVNPASGGTNALVTPKTMNFTPANWQTPQKVTVAVGEDADFTDTTLTLNAVAPGQPPRSVSVHGLDRDVDEEVVGPFASWANAKTDFGATGNGIADDTAALQSALNALRPADGKPALFLPPGTYRLTGTLRLSRTAHSESKDFIILGEDPATTVLRWDGPGDGVMLAHDAWYSKIARLTFDGRGRAKTAISHGDAFSTYNEYSDLAFENLAFAIEAGSSAGLGIAETTVLRCHFRRCSDTAISIQNANSLDWFIWHSQFEDCGRGVSNLRGSGNFHVYESLFRNSAEADVSIGNTGYFSIRNNTSVGSRAFFTATPVNSCGLITIQGNTVTESGAIPIQIGNLGPVLLFDNNIQTLTNVAANIEPSAGLASVGNTFTIEGAIDGKPSATRLDDRVICEAIPVALPRLPGPLRNRRRRILEVAPNADGAGIQKAIDQAAQAGETRPVVHLPAGTYLIRETLVIPAGSDLQLVGDGGKTGLRWAGGINGPLLRLAGPSRASVRDLALFGQFNDVFVNGVEIEHCDQPESRVFMDQVLCRRAGDTGLLVDGLENTDVSLHSFYHTDNRVGLKVAGRPNSLPTQLTSGRVVVFGGGASNNNLSYEVADGGRLLVRDVWYETPLAEYPRFMVCTNRGSFTLHGANIAPSVSQWSVPAVDVSDFDGDLTFLATMFTFPNTRLSVSGEGKNTSVLLLGTYGPNDPDFESPNARATLLESFRQTEQGPNASENAGPRDDDFLRRMLQMARRERPRPLVPLRAGATDVRLYRVSVDGAKIGIHLKQ
ncbi:MAG: hypothetical protein L0Z50_28295 [Verrucomicrobiales bacterium]|nr:hypothetical protein [Verrucomicrobiales bacterium]